MEKAQELAQGSKQDQHIAALAQKAHDISELQNSLGGGKYNSHTQFACSFGGWKWRLKGSFGGWKVVEMLFLGLGWGFFGFCFPVWIWVTNQISLQFIYLSNKSKC